MVVRNGAKEMLPSTIFYALNVYALHPFSIGREIIGSSWVFNVTCSRKMIPRNVTEAYKVMISNSSHNGHQLFSIN